MSKAGHLQEPKAALILILLCLFAVLGIKPRPYTKFSYGPTTGLYSSRKWCCYLKRGRCTSTLQSSAWCYFLTSLTCACNQCHKVFYAFSLAKFSFCQGSTVTIIVHPHREMQSVRQWGPEVHRVPFLNQFGRMQHNAFQRIYTTTSGNAWTPSQTQGKQLISNLMKILWA